MGMLLSKNKSPRWSLVSFLASPVKDLWFFINFYWFQKQRFLKWSQANLFVELNGKISSWYFCSTPFLVWRWVFHLLWSAQLPLPPWTQLLGSSVHVDFRQECGVRLPGGIFQQEWNSGLSISLHGGWMVHEPPGRAFARYSLLLFLFGHSWDSHCLSIEIRREQPMQSENFSV